MLQHLPVAVQVPETAHTANTECVYFTNIRQICPILFAPKKIVLEILVYSEVLGGFCRIRSGGFEFKLLRLLGKFCDDFLPPTTEP